MNATQMMAKQDAEFAEVYNCVMTGDGCAKLINDVVFMVSNGTVEFVVQESDIAHMMMFHEKLMNCAMNGEGCQQLIIDSVFTLSNGIVMLTMEDIERAQLVVDCLMI